MTKIGFDRMSLADAQAKIVSETDSELTMSAVIAREMVQPYPGEGMAFKPADELEKAAWTAEGRWIIPLEHPSTGLITRREDIAGRMANVRFVKDIMDPKTKRPMVRGIKADLTWFKDRTPKAVLDALHSRSMSDVSIGFTYEEDRTPGNFNGEKYDFVQRNIMIDHLCAPTQVGRCPSPYCGIGVDSGIIASGSQLRKIAGDPWEETEEYIRSGHREPPESGECRTMTLGDGIKAVVCNYSGKWEVQSYLFPRDKFTLEEAKAWFETHKDQKDTPEFAIHEADDGSGQPEKPCPIVAKITELNPEGFAKLMRERFSTSELSRLFAPAITQLAASSSPAAPAASNGNTAPAIPPVLQQQANKAGQQAAPTAAVSPTAAINVPSTTSGAAQLPGTGMGGNATVEELSALTQEVIERAKRLNPDPSSEL